MLENEEREFFKEHLFTVDNITEEIIKQMKDDEGIIITTESRKIIDIEAIWSEDEEYEDCWYIDIYDSYNQYVNCEYTSREIECMKDFGINKFLEIFKKYS